MQKEKINYYYYYIIIILTRDQSLQNDRFALFINDVFGE